MCIFYAHVKYSGLSPAFEHGRLICNIIKYVEERRGGGGEEEDDDDMLAISGGILRFKQCHLSDYVKMHFEIKV